MIHQSELEEEVKGEQEIDDTVGTPEPSDGPEAPVQVGRVPR